MARALSFSRDARKFVDGLEAKQFKQVVNRCLDLMGDPRPHDSEQLQGYDKYRIDQGEFRIIYEYSDDLIEIMVVDRRNDDAAYKQLKRKSKRSR